MPRTSRPDFLLLYPNLVVPVRRSPGYMTKISDLVGKKYVLRPGWGLTMHTLCQDARNVDGILMLDFGGGTASINMYKEIADGSIAAHSHWKVLGCSDHNHFDGSGTFRDGVHSIARHGGRLCTNRIMLNWDISVGLNLRWRTVVQLQSHRSCLGSIRLKAMIITRRVVVVFQKCVQTYSMFTDGGASGCGAPGHMLASGSRGGGIRSVCNKSSCSRVSHRQWRAGSAVDERSSRDSSAREIGRAPATYPAPQILCSCAKTIRQEYGYLRGGCTRDLATHSGCAGARDGIFDGTILRSTRNLITVDEKPGLHGSAGTLSGVLRLASLWH
ncbi:hypothetical protein GGX14DRAFT_391720 [Mycena pura]|uniref:Uncharacterized protein n=1 Tax=Mycena pura TaxID=153505 RepID=A0AAD6YII1_9AGAR|nr:hypothetical protein GGX14DRAFT_391720 [Mycena pura]